MIVKAEELIKKRTAEYSNLIGVNYNTIRIKDTKTRWGSCSSKGNLNFNFRILMAPEQVMDYIIVHELCHLRHMNHGKDFWNTVAQYMPDYEKKKEWLKVNGMKLYAI
jgi:predicted metal-dependent hydrolase